MFSNIMTNLYNVNIKYDINFKSGLKSINNSLLSNHCRVMLKERNYSGKYVPTQVRAAL